jgi:MerR family transcriptional regulator, mercuric resistance operon regulatory protein
MNPHDITANSNMTIGALARIVGVNLETIRFYQRKGLMPEPRRVDGAIRRYGATALARVQFIKSAQRLGFSLDEVAELLRLDDGAHCLDARALAVKKLVDVRERLADLSRIEQVLDELVQHCGSARGKVACPLIASLRQVNA